MTIQYYKTKTDIYIYMDNQFTRKLEHCFFNGKKLKPTWVNSFKKLEGETEITSVYYYESVYVESNYELINPEIASESIPLSLTEKDVLLVYDEDCDDHKWSGKYSAYESLYKVVHSAPVKVKKELEFESELLGIIDEDQLQMSNIDENIEQVFKNIKHTDLYSTAVQMLIPELLRHNYPCKISSELFFSIIKEHVKKNIDATKATISKNYDFLFTVDKFFESSPFTVTHEFYPTATSRKPRFKRVVLDKKQAIIYSITSKKDNYDNKGLEIVNDVCPEMKGANLKELLDNINAYLTELMNHINKPTEVCENCNGMGYFISKLSFK